MTDKTDGGGGPDGNPPDSRAHIPEVGHHASTLPGTMSVGSSRAELAANHIARLAAGVQPGERIGSKDDVRQLCGFSVGTVNEAIKLAQERGVITSRPGPGGGIFALDPSPLSRMNGWFRSAASEYSALDESIQIRDALAPLLVDEALARITADDQRALNDLLSEVQRTRDAHDVVEFAWAAWSVHEYFAGIGRSQLLDSLYLSIMDVGTSHLRARLEAGDETGQGYPPVYLEGFAEVIEDLVVALDHRNADAAVDALRRTDPTMILRPKPTEPRRLESSPAG
jgi:DNA-binding FadR family transcriptional regulator